MQFIFDAAEFCNSYFKIRKTKPNSSLSNRFMIYVPIHQHQTVQNIQKENKRFKKKKKKRNLNKNTYRSITIDNSR